MSTLYLSLGSNLGDKEANIRRAVSMIDSTVGRVGALSSLITTEPWGFKSEHNFVNAVVRVETRLQPQAVLTATQAIERAIGRKEKSVNSQYHDRLIDIDILLYDDLRLNEDGLTIPHPLMFERDFVMQPLREVLTAEDEKLIDQMQKDNI